MQLIFETYFFYNSINNYNIIKDEAKAHHIYLTKPHFKQENNKKDLVLSFVRTDLFDWLLFSVVLSIS